MIRDGSDEIVKSFSIGSREQRREKEEIFFKVKNLFLSPKGSELRGAVPSTWLSYPCGTKALFFPMTKQKQQQEKPSSW